MHKNICEQSIWEGNENYILMVNSDRFFYPYTYRMMALTSEVKNIYISKAKDEKVIILSETIFAHLIGIHSTRPLLRRTSHTHLLQQEFGAPALLGAQDGRH